MTKMPVKSLVLNANGYLNIVTLSRVSAFLLSYKFATDIMSTTASMPVDLELKKVRSYILSIYLPFLIGCSVKYHAQGYTES